MLYLRALVSKLTLNSSPAFDQFFQKGALITEPVLICKEIILTTENCFFIHLTNTHANLYILYLLCVSIILGTEDTMIRQI